MYMQIIKLFFYYYFALFSYMPFSNNLIHRFLITLRIQNYINYN